MTVETVPVQQFAEAAVQSPATAALVKQKQTEVPAVPEGQAGYYDIPMLKEPLWKWEVAGYFFLGGVSAGAYLLARMAERFGGPKLHSVTRIGTEIAWATMLPCAPLLIRDLGDKTRFHYMLRIFKPKSPMNLGAWALTGYGACVTAAALREWMIDRGNWPRGGALTAAAEAANDVVGIPAALLIAGYTGVLLSTTATPVWSRNPWIGPLFSASALSSGASCVRLLLAPDQHGAQSPAHSTLETIENAGRAAEAVCLAGYIASAGEEAKPLTEGSQAGPLWAGAVGAGMVAPVIMDAAAKRAGRSAPWLKVGAAALGLLGGLALRWAVVHAGIESAHNSRPGA